MQIKPVSSIVHTKLAKILLYGGPGTGKTPICANVPDTVMCITEPGTLSIKKCNVDVAECYTTKDINDFFTWLKSDTKEKQKYKNVCIDSVSEMCAIHIRESEVRGSKSGGEAHGLKVYGDMAKAVLRDLIYLNQNKEFNVFLIAKRGEVDFEGITKFRPYFPGKQLTIEVPHLFDEIFHLDRTQGKWEFPDNIPALVNDLPRKTVPAILTRESNIFTARDRSGVLNAVEYPDLSYVLYKIANF